MRVVFASLLALALLGSAERASAQGGAEQELPDKVLLILNDASTADDPQQQMAMVEVGNVLDGRDIEFVALGAHPCTMTSDGCLAIRDEQGADAVVIVSVYAGDPGSVDLQLFDATMSGEGTQSWIGDPSTAAGQAMQQALDTFRPETVRVTLTGSPEGATVWIGRRTGRLPFIGTLAPGEHRLRISADGYRTHTETVVIPATDTEWSHQVQLEEGEDPAVADPTDPSDPANPTPRSNRGLLLGLGATGIGAGVALAIAGGVLLTKDGDCVDDGCPRTDDDRRTYERYETTTGGVILLVGGVVAAAVGVGLVVAGVRVEPSVGPDHATLSLSGSF